MGRITALDILEAFSQASLGPFSPRESVQYNPGDIILSLAYIPFPAQVAVPLTLRRLDREPSDGLIVSSTRIEGPTREEIKAYLCAQVDELFDTIAMIAEPKGQLGQ